MRVVENAISPSAPPSEQNGLAVNGDQAHSRTEGVFPIRAAGGPQYAKAEYLLSHHAFRGNEVVWDLGAGDCAVATELIAPKIPRGVIVGIDIDAAVIEVAEGVIALHSGVPINVIQGDITQIDRHILTMRELGGGRGPDVVVSNSVFNYCLKDLAAHRELLERVGKEMPAGAVLLFSFTGAGNFSNLEDGRAVARNDPAFREYFRDYKDPGRHDPSPAEYEALLLECGFTPVDLYLCDAGCKDQNPNVPRQIFPTVAEAAAWIKDSILSHMKFLRRGGASEVEQMAFATLVVNSFIEAHPEYLQTDGSVELDNVALVVHARKN